MKSLIVALLLILLASSSNCFLWSKTTPEKPWFSEASSMKECFQMLVAKCEGNHWCINNRIGDCLDKKNFPRPTSQ